MNDTNTPAEEPASPHTDQAGFAALEGEFLPGGGDAGPGAAQAEPEIPTHQILSGLLLPLFTIAAPNWRMGKMECDQLGVAYGALIDKYFPDGVGQWAPEILAVSTTVIVFGPRLRTPMRDEPKREAAADAHAG